MDILSKLEQSHYLLAAAAVVLLGAATWIVRGLYGPLAHLPGPWYSKWTFAVLRWHWLRGDQATYIHGLHEKYGPVVRCAPTEVNFALVEAKQQIYKVKETFRKTDHYTRLVGKAITNNLFATSDIDHHRKLRRLLSSPMSENSLKNVEFIVRERVELTMQRIKEEMKTRGAADLFKWHLFMATDVIGELSFGESFRMLEKGGKNTYIEDLENIGMTSSWRSVFPTLVDIATDYRIPTPIRAINKTVASGRNLFIYAQQSLDRYRGQVERDPENVKPSLFTKLFKGEEEETLSFLEILHSSMAYIVAGSDTTATTLTYLVWAVCKHPAVLERLVKEVAELPADFKEHDVQRLPYVNQVIEETLRLWPAAGGVLPRAIPPEGATIAGVDIPGGMTVSCQAHSLHRNPDVFPDPEKFDPDRWEYPTKDMRDSFFAFGGGARVCIGLHLARMELRLATALFFRNFQHPTVSTREGMCDDDMTLVTYFLFSPKGKRCLIEAR